MQHWMRQKLPDTSTSGDSTQVLIPISEIEEKSPEKAESLSVDEIIKLFDDIKMIEVRYI